jgi:hypothetical protein
MDFYTKGRYVALEKLGSVKGPLKQYRRLRQMLQEGSSFFHATGKPGADAILQEGAIMPGKTNYYGVGSYFQRGKPSAHGPLAFAKSPAKAEELGMQMVKDPARADWALVPGTEGAALSAGDTLLVKEWQPGLKPLVEKARQQGLRVISPEVISTSSLGAKLTPETVQKLQGKIKKRGF